MNSSVGTNKSVGQRDMCKILLWSAKYILNKSTSNVIEFRIQSK